jgi:uncharacterized protein (TIGR03435 family)
LRGDTLGYLITQAYGVKSYQISGPEWMNSDRFDITAKMPDGATREQIPQMLQSLLAERFKLTIHRESRVLPVYALVVGKDGQKLREAEPASTNADDASTAPRLMIRTTARARQIKGQVTMAGLAGILSTRLDRPVLDSTELTSTYDVDITWTPDGITDQLSPALTSIVAAVPGSGGGTGAVDVPPDAPADSIFSVLRNKLGLRLEARKAPVEVLAIDGVRRIPTEN